MTDSRDHRAATHEEVLAAVSASLGREVRSLPELYSGPVTYQPAIPTLTEMLSWELERADKEGIARCLAVKAARGLAGPALIRELRRDPRAHPGTLWALANAVEVVATPDLESEIAEMAQDISYGHARQMLALALGKTGEPAAVEVLISLLRDPLVDGHALQALGKLATVPQAQSSRGPISAFIDSPITWKRNAAKATLRKLDKASGRHQ